MKQKKHIFTLIAIILFCSFSGLAQIPAGYYNNAAGKTGDILRAALRDIVTNGAVKLPYTTTSSTMDVWKAFAVTDVKPVPNSTIIWDMYSDVPGGTPAYTYTVITDQCGTAAAEGVCYAREHCVPNSWWNGIDNAGHPQYTDLHHLYPADQFVNNEKSDHPLGQVSSPTFTSTNGSKVGPCSWPGYTGTVFEPIDGYKGDFARAYLYIATRYMDSLSAWVNNYPGTEAQYVINSTGNNFKQWFIDMLVTWSNNDPVSQKEISRNDSIYYNTPQHNRNPFVDHPEYICQIWTSQYCVSSSACLDEGFDAVTPPTAPTGWTFTNIQSGSTYTSSGNYGATSPSLKMDATGDIIITPVVSGATALSFWIKGVSTNSTSALLVEGFNGSTWSTIDNINPLPTSGTTETYNASSSPVLAAGFTQFRFTYTKGAGNLAFDDVSVTCGTSACTTPLNQSTNIHFTNVGSSSMTVNWTRGSGDNVIVLCRLGSAVNSDPVNSTTYTANSVFASGSQVGTGNYVVYSGAANAVTITGLTANKKYYFSVYEYNSSGLCYKTPGLSGNQLTTVGTGINISEVPLKDEISPLYPNPSSQIISFTLDATVETSINIELINYLGQKIYANKQKVSLGYNKVECNISQFPKGIYSLSVSSANGKICNKRQFVIQ
jgi:endonuclease I